MTPAARPKAVCFDLDGTLVDNFEAIHAAYSHAARTLDLQPEPYAVVRSAVGGSLPITLGKLFPAALVDAAVKEHLAHYDAHWREGLQALPGADALLRALQAQGTPVAMVTNKEGYRAREIAEALGWTERFALILGIGDIDSRKPEPAFMLHALQQLEVSPEAALMIGDSPYDAEAAQAVDMPLALVATGTHTSEALETLHAGRVFPDMIALAHGALGLTLEA